MRILQIHPMMKTLHGSEHVVIDLSRRFVRDGCDVEIITLYIAEECRRELDNRVKVRELRCAFGKEGIVGTGLQYFVLPLWVILATRKYDVILAHASGSILAAFFLKRTRGGRLVYYCYEPPRFVYDLLDITRKRLSLLERGLLAVFTPFLRWIDVFSTRSADRVLTLSQYNANSINTIYGIGNVYVAYPGVELSRFPYHGTIKKKDDCFVLLSVGKLHHRKNLELQLYALRRLIGKYRHIRLVVVGYGSRFQDLISLINLFCHILIPYSLASVIRVIFLHQLNPTLVDLLCRSFLFQSEDFVIIFHAI
mgnify:CR=1 FL=1